MNKIKLAPHSLQQMTEPEFIPQGVISIGALNYWKRSITGKNQVIAVIDSGCDVEHEDLKENIIGSIDFTDDSKEDSVNVTDYLGHGTHISGIIAASGNGLGVKGIAPDSKLLILKVINKRGAGTYNSLIKAIDYAINWKGSKGEKVSIINMSLGGEKENKLLREKIKEAVSSQIILIGAAGNNGDGNTETHEILYPSAYKEVIQVGSVGNTGQPSLFSNSNLQIDFLAPGENIVSTLPKGKYGEMSGTSMAAPHVTGAVALILESINDVGNYNLADVYNTLIESASYYKYKNSLEGYGQIKLKAK